MLCNWFHICAQVRKETESSKVNFPSLLPFTNANTHLSQQRRKRKMTRGDGNCLFKAISHFVHGREDAHAEVRKCLVSFLQANRMAFLKQFLINESWQEHITSMRWEGVWATQVELYVSASYYQVPVYLCSPHPTTKEYRWLVFRPVNSAQLIFGESSMSHFNAASHMELCHTAGDHFDCIVDQQSLVPTTNPPQLISNSTSFISIS